MASPPRDKIKNGSIITGEKNKYPDKQLNKLLKLNRNNIVRGIILSEVLGKPKALRKKPFLNK